LAGGSRKPPAAGESAGPSSGKLGLRKIWNPAGHRADRRYGINLPLSVFEAGSGSPQENVSKKTEALFSIRTERL
jgi:hypothetical protein